MTNSVNAERFGGDYPKLQSARDGIDRYLIAGTCMGLDIETGEVYAPNGRPTLSTDCLESIQNPQARLVRPEGEQLSGSLALAQDRRDTKLN